MGVGITGIQEETGVAFGLSGTPVPVGPFLCFACDARGGRQDAVPATPSNPIHGTATFRAQVRHERRKGQSSRREFIDAAFAERQGVRNGMHMGCAAPACISSLLQRPYLR